MNRGQSVGLCAEFPILSYLAGTDEAALCGIRKLVGEVVAELVENGEVVPEPHGRWFQNREVGQ